MITTSDEQIAERARTLRFHGSHDKVTYEQLGYNSRLDELQAAILRVQLPHLDAGPTGAGAPARHYEQAGLGELVRAAARRPRARSPAWHLYVVAPPAGRSAWKRALAAAGDRPQAPTTARPSTASRRCASGARASSCPATEEAARTHLAIPMSPVLTREQAEEVVAAARSAT